MMGMIHSPRRRAIKLTILQHSLKSTMPDPALHSEWLTRTKRIDVRLRSLGWDIVPFDGSIPHSAWTKHAVEEFPTGKGPADYAPCVNGRILGIVEAKKLSWARRTCSCRPNAIPAARPSTRSHLASSASRSATH
jgi:hypothetical protein